MNARSESLVKCCDTIGCQKEYALEVLQHTQKDTDKRITTDVVKLPLFEEDVCLVNKQNRTPCVGDVKYCGEALLDIATFYSKFSNRYRLRYKSVYCKDGRSETNVERFLEQLADAFSCECFPRTRRSMQHRHKATPLA